MNILLIVVILPMSVLFGGLAILAKLSGRDSVKKLLREKTPDRRPGGYDESVVRRQWEALTKAGLLETEERFFKMDLVFPLFYGGTFAASFLMAWAALGRPFNPLWLLVPVGLACLADWTETLVLLGQIQRYPTLQPDRIQVASNATRLKWLFLRVLFLILVLLVILILRREVF